MDKETLLIKRKLLSTYTQVASDEWIGYHRRRATEETARIQAELSASEATHARAKELIPTLTEEIAQVERVLSFNVDRDVAALEAQIAKAQAELEKLLAAKGSN